MTIANVEKAETDVFSLVDRIEDWQLHPNQFEGSDLAIALALLYPDAAFVRDQGGEGTSVLRREADGSWYFVD